MGEGGWEAEGRLGIGGDTEEFMKDEGQSPSVYQAPETTGPHPGTGMTIQ